MTRFTQLKANELDTLERNFPAPIGFIAKSSKNALTFSFVKDYFTPPSGRFDSNLLQKIVNEISDILETEVDHFTMCIKF